MNAHKKPPFRRRRLGKRLRALRDAAGLSLDDAAKKLDKSRTALFRIETGETRADVHLIRSIMDVYDRWEEGLLDAARAALKPSWFTAYRVQDMGYVDVETEASQVFDYPGMSLPGLLHTDAYIRAMFERAHRQRSPKQIANDVTVRLIRQRRLTSEEDPLRLVAVVDEAALHREVGGPEIMREQLLHLVDMAALPTVTLYVLPLRSSPSSAMAGAFTLLAFPDPEEQELLYHEYVTGALHIEDESEVREAKLVFEMLCGEALTPDESVTLIEQLAGRQDVPS